MLSEEGLILVVVLVACALVVLGVLELAWPTRPRHPVRPTEAARDPWRRARSRAVPPQGPVSSRAETAVAERALANTSLLFPDASEFSKWERRDTPLVVSGADPALPAVIPATVPSAVIPAAIVASAPQTVAVAEAVESPVVTGAIDEVPPPDVVAVEIPAAPPRAVVTAETCEPAPPVEAAEPIAPTPAADMLEPTLAPPDLHLVSPPIAEVTDAPHTRPRRARPRPLPRSAWHPAPPGKPAAPDAVSLVPSSADSPAEIATSAAPEMSVVERCFALLRDERLAEVVSVAEEGLKTRQARGISVPSPEAAQEAAGLWGVVGLAKQKLDDFRGARFAFEEAIAVAPGTERATWERHLATLALTAGRRAIDDGETEPSSPARIDSLRAAIDWLERGLVVAPHDVELRDALAGARDTLWPAYEAVVRKLVRSRKVAEARRTLDEVIADPDCPPERRGAFRRLLGSAMGTEAGQATAEAARHMQGGREAEAVAALARAESTIAAIAADALAARRRRELEHRLWRGYMKLGVGRVEAGEHEAAIDPLFHALSFTESGSERQDETRTMLARALGELVDRRIVQIEGLADAGDTGAASAGSDELRSLLRRAEDQGLPDSHLTDASDKVRALFRRLGKPE